MPGTPRSRHSGDDGPGGLTGDSGTWPADADPDGLGKLLGGVAEGDMAAFEAMYDNVSPKVGGLVRRILRDAAQAEEVTQEVFVEVWRNAPRYDSARGTALTWILTIAHRRSVDRVRAAQSSRERDLLAGQRDNQIAYDEVAEQVEGRLEAADVRQCLDSLTDLQRESLQLAYWGGHTYPEVARLLDAPLGTIKTRLRDGLTRMRACLGAA